MRPSHHAGERGRGEGERGGTEDAVRLYMKKNMTNIEHNIVQKALRVNRENQCQITNYII